MSIKINGTDVVDNNRKGIFQSANVGTFANPARPGSAATGDLIWSTTDNQLQVWNGSAWVAAVGAGQVISASGGSTFTPGNGFKLHIFTSPGTFTLSSPSAQVEYAVVAGGGGSGANDASGGAAGGAGGVTFGTATWSSGSYSITIGSGGAGGLTGPRPVPQRYGSNGQNSSVSGPSGTYSATGGGGGASYTSFPLGGGSNEPFGGSPGGCGGGAAGRTGPISGPFPLIPGGSGVPGQGFPGSSGPGFAPFGGVFFIGAGGGADESAGSGPGVYSAGRGVVLDWGIPSSYGSGTGSAYKTGSSGYPYPATPERGTGRVFGGGGAGDSQSAWAGAPGGGGTYPGGNGSANTGGGAGGAGAASGGSGIVIIRYRTIQ